MAILFSIDGVPAVKRFLGLAVKNMRDPRPALKFIGEDAIVSNQRRLRRGVDVHGRPMTPSRRAQRDGGQTLLDSGALGGSLHYEAGASALDLFSSDKRAGVHYRGDVITPKKAKFLTIPLRAAGGGFAGVIGGVDLKDNRTGARARHYTNTFVKRFGDRLYIMQRTSGGRLRALFLLLKSVRLPKREWMGFSESDQTMAAERLGRHVAGEKQ